jgi:enoyl-CoA hydratase
MIHREQHGAVEVLRIEHGKVQARDLELCQELMRTFGELEQSKSRAFVLTAAGTTFSAGVDLWRILEGGRSYIERFLPAMEAAFHASSRARAADPGRGSCGSCSRWTRSSARGAAWR